MSDGIGCVCAARSEYECCCDADWRPQELIDLQQQLASRDAEIAELVSILSAVNEHMNVPGWCEFSTNEDARNYHNTARRVERALITATEPKNETI